MNLSSSLSACVCLHILLNCTSKVHNETFVLWEAMKCAARGKKVNSDCHDFYVNGSLLEILNVDAWLAPRRARGDTISYMGRDSNGKGRGIMNGSFETERGRARWLKDYYQVLLQFLHTGITPPIMVAKTDEELEENKYLADAEDEKKDLERKDLKTMVHKHSPLWSLPLITVSRFHDFDFRLSFPTISCPSYSQMELYSRILPLFSCSISSQLSFLRHLSTWTQRLVTTDGYGIVVIATTSLVVSWDLY